MDLQLILDILADFAGQVLIIVLPFLASAAAAWLVAKAKQLLAEAKNTAGSNVGYFLEQAASLAVSAAEQTLKANDEKKAYALKLASDYLLARGVKLDAAVIAGAIEAAVFDELHAATKRQSKSSTSRRN